METTSEQEKFSEMASGLHQAAQPLTVLQGCLELALEGPPTADDYRRSINQALSESRRLAACFDRVRELVRKSNASEVRSSTVSQPATAEVDAEEIGCVHV